MDGWDDDPPCILLHIRDYEITSIWLSLSSVPEIKPAGAVCVCVCV